MHSQLISLINEKYFKFLQKNETFSNLIKLSWNYSIFLFYIFNVRSHIITLVALKTLILNTFKTYKPWLMMGVRWEEEEVISANLQIKHPIFKWQFEFAILQRCCFRSSSFSNQTKSRLLELHLNCKYYVVVVMSSQYPFFCGSNLVQ